MTSEGGKKIRGQGPASPFAPLQPLLQPHEQDAADGVHKLSAALADFEAPVRLHIQILDGDAAGHWDVGGGPGAGGAQHRAPEHPDVMVVLRSQTWLQIAHGTVSPFDALFAGRLRVGGDTALATRLVRHLSDPAVPFVAPCRGSAQ